ncbi:hypothetical protein CC1G_08247 [Coprinopsis cinerea okayama7|uniref:TECPR1-like DysF domain-containing protein n=1 Tax=Coprinopsis cinerea (strain Okayama-7 / 130 / ATCC MYA-4618 / FGSC 9003) TaxID=240176 RepID=A8P7K3_COPC7|nr:hypothetical protein CC1G_08247 [Coprinopsis cinerea okayama7\|eukprot:XP_001839380.2 hypothetical protein CC1G_08247 [Coprinopsis cinerea okayama7\
MTNNFKRFVSKIGPVFWLQDRIEEIVLWKRGWKVTLTWMALYAFLCYFPKFVLLLPHAAIIGIILSTYPYPPSGSPFSLNTSAPSSSDPNGQDTAHLHAPATAPEGSIPWQANIQGIQNLMGAVSDLFTAVEPYVYHFVLTPAHLREPPSSRTSRSTTSTASGGQSSSHSVPPTHSPYTPHILILLTVTFPLLAFLISLPTFPTRLVFLLGGLAPFMATNPLVQRAVNRLRSNPLVGVALRKFVLEKVVPTIRTAISIAQERTRWLVSFLGLFLGRGLGKRPSSPPKQIKDAGSLFGPGAGTTGPGTGSTNEKDKISLLLKQPLSTVVQRIIDNDRLTDKCWNSEMWEVELWENESSNLTFSLAPGWSFVETEDWRKDVVGEWSGVGCDEDGWVYTNDAWLGARPAPYTAGGGSVTRRRRWTRRVWFDVELAKLEEGNGKSAK